MCIYFTLVSASYVRSLKIIIFHVKINKRFFELFGSLWYDVNPLKVDDKAN